MMALKVAIGGSEGEYSRFGGLALNGNIGGSQTRKYSAAGPEQNNGWLLKQRILISRKFAPPAMRLKASEAPSNDPRGRKGPQGTSRGHWRLSAASAPRSR